MSAREHCLEAERLLDLAERTDCDPMSIIASAQAHATIALALATIDIAKAALAVKA